MRGRAIPREGLRPDATRGSSSADRRADAEAAFAAAWTLAGRPNHTGELPRREAFPATGTVMLLVIASARETTELYRMDLPMFRNVMGVPGVSGLVLTLVLVAVIGPGPVLAQEPQRPAYLKLRYDEDWSSLRDPTRRTEPLLCGNYAAGLPALLRSIPSRSPGS